MSEVSPQNKRPSTRQIRPAEEELIEWMLAASDAKFTMRGPLSAALVEDMDDGGMGSILLLPSAGQGNRTARAIAKGEYVDEDGVLVIIVINADQNGELFEVDFFKVDFSPLRRYPRVSDIKIDATQ